MSKLCPEKFFNVLKEAELDFFCGVPDSLLKDFNAYVTDTLPAEKNIIAANEGAALGLATGYHMATGKIGVVYLQNSGTGNIVNPLLSISDPQCYGIPTLFIIGWRGQPGVKDEPQHVKQGRVQEGLLKTMEIPYVVLDSDVEKVKDQVKTAVSTMREKNVCYALLVRKGLFESYKLKSETKTSFALSREQAIGKVIDALSDDDVVVSTTGKPSREVFEYREAKKQGHANDFLTIGGMGHCSQIALGVAMSQPKRQVLCLDGDGAVLMHMGSLAIIGQSGCKNFKHVVVNNGAHDSVGGQPTVGFNVDFCKIAEACGYVKATSVDTPEAVDAALKALLAEDGPAFVEIRVNKGARSDLGRPTTTPIQNKEAFMKHLAK